MKVKKVKTRHTFDSNIVQPFNEVKTVIGDQLLNGNQTIDAIQENDLTIDTIDSRQTEPMDIMDTQMEVLPDLKTIPDFKRILDSDGPFPPMPVLHQIPHWNIGQVLNPVLDTNNHMTGPDLNTSTDSLFGNIDDQLAKDIFSLIEEQYHSFGDNNGQMCSDMPEISPNCVSQTLFTANPPFISSNYFPQTSSPLLNVNHLGTNHINCVNSYSINNNNVIIGDVQQGISQIPVNTNNTIPINNNNMLIGINGFAGEESAAKQTDQMPDKRVNIDLSDDTNSPKSSSVEESMPSTSGYSQTLNNSYINSSHNRKSCPSHTYPNPNSQSSGSAKPSFNCNSLNRKFRPFRKYISVKPIRYCAKNFRVMGVYRQSARNKNSTKDENYDYSTVSWSELDGTKYECSVSKWREDEEIMTEQKRKEILSKVEAMKYRKSIYKEDKGVYYSFQSFITESNPTDGLKCIVRLDPEAVKHEKFNGYYCQRLFVLSGQCVLSVENNKHRKNVVTEQEIFVNEHTRYQLENRNVEECYIYAIVFKRQT